MLVGDYIELSSPPEVPLNRIPDREECMRYEYIFIKQLCNIAYKHGLSRSQTRDDFGGHKGMYQVAIERKARVYGNRKYVLVSAVIQYLEEKGITEW